jgi:hypothetical protein
MDDFLGLSTFRDGATSKDELLSAYAGALLVVQDMGKLSGCVMKISPRVRLKEKSVADHALQQVHLKFV